MPSESSARAVERAAATEYTEVHAECLADQGEVLALLGQTGRGRPVLRAGDRALREEGRRVPRGADARPSRRGSGRLAVPVVELLDPPHDADAAEGELVRARVVGDVVRLPRSVGEVCERGRRPPGRSARRPYPAAGRRRGQAARRAPRRPRRSVPSPSSTTKISSSAEWQCGGQPIRPAGIVTAERPVFDRPCSPPEIALEEERLAVLALDLLDVVDVDDRGRALEQLADLRLAGGSLPLERVVVADRDDVDERRRHPCDPRARAERCSRAGAAARRRGHRARPGRHGGCACDPPAGGRGSRRRRPGKRRRSARRYRSRRGRRRAPPPLPRRAPASTTCPGRPGCA